MSDDQQPAVIGWEPEEGGTPGRRRWGRLFDGDWLDRRFAPLLAGAGAVAFFMALVSDWQVTSITEERRGPDEVHEVPLGIAQVDGWNIGIFVGLFGLAAFCALAVLGPPAARRLLRPPGLAWAATLGAVLLATAVDLGERSFVEIPMFFFDPDAPAPEVTTGRGGYLAMVGTALLAAALHLTARDPRLPPADPDDPHTDTNQETPTDPAGTPPDHTDPPTSGRRRRLRSRREAPPALGPPPDLTVRPTTPFTHPTDR